MSIGERIKSAVAPIVPEVSADTYSGNAQTYCTWNATEIPTAHADNEPHAIHYLAQLHLFVPFRSNPTKLKRQLRRALLNADFTAPTVETVDASEEEGRHIVFEFESVEREVF